MDNTYLGMTAVRGYRTGRGQGRPRTRWTDDIVKYAGGDWIESAPDAGFQKQLEPGYTEGL